MKNCAWCRRPLPPGHPGAYCDWVCSHVVEHDQDEGDCAACDALNAEWEMRRGTAFTPRAHEHFEAVAEVIKEPCAVCGGHGVLGTIDRVHGDVTAPWYRCEACERGVVDVIRPVKPERRLIAVA